MLLATTCLAASAAGGDGCSVKSRSAGVVIMVCASGVDSTGWRMAAQAACGSKQTCNVWIWDDAAKAPGKAPATDAELPKSATAQARAVWANDSQSLLTIRKVGAN